MENPKIKIMHPIFDGSPLQHTCPYEDCENNSHNRVNFQILKDSEIFDIFVCSACRRTTVQPVKLGVAVSF